MYDFYTGKPMFKLKANLRFIYGRNNALIENKCYIFIKAETKIKLEIPVK